MYLLLLPLLSLLTIGVFSHDITEYTNKDIRYPKCCPRGSYLHYETANSTLTCLETTSVYFEINAKPISNYTENCNEKCVDFLVFNNGTAKLIIPNCDTEVYSEVVHYKTYPKCCPLGYFYDLEAHGCVFNPDAGFPEDQGVFVKTGLSQCRDGKSVLIDHLVKNVRVDKSLDVFYDGLNSKSGRYCFDETVDGRKLVRTCEDYSRACMKYFDDNGVRCIKKCCPDGQIYVGSKCKIVPGYGLNINNTSRIKNNDDHNYGIIQALNQRKYIALQKHNFFIDKMGNLHVSVVNRWKLYTSDEAIYCIEYISRKNTTERTFFLFLLNEDAFERVKFNLLAIVLSISCVFAMATLVCYTLLPEMHNLYGKSIMMYCLVLTLSFSLLAFVQFQFERLSSDTCATLGFLVQFSFLAGFSWLNVICFDMWMAFGQLRVKGISSKKSDLKRFVYYNIYGWSVPTIITLMTYTVYRTKCLPDILVPHLGKIKCFFDKRIGTYDHFLFFIGPLTVLIVINVVFFVKTIMYCFKVKDQINRMKASPTSDKTKKSQKLKADMEKLTMMVKLCIIMGVSWLTEIISSIISFDANDTMKTIEAITDVFNCLQGVFIFCIFILKRSVLTSLKNKLFPKDSTGNLCDVSTAMTSVSENANGKHGRKTSQIKINAA